VQLFPLAGSSILAIDITPAMLRDINKHLKDDVSSDIVLEYSMDIKTGIFIAASRVPTSAETACMLKHARRLLTVPGVVPIQSAPVTLTSFLKVINIPHIPAEPKVWQTTQRTAFQAALRASPVGVSFDTFIKHALRFMPATLTLVSRGSTFQIQFWVAMPGISLVSRSSSAAVTVKSRALPISPVPLSALGA
jgi:hypothetical protein